MACAQTDKKNLGAKAMMQEIKDIVEKRRQADASLAAVSSSAPFVSRLSPDLTYNYRDRCADLKSLPLKCEFTVHRASFSTFHRVLS